MITYQKTPLTSAAHITQLRRRGLDISDQEKAEKYLKTIGYYRLSAYFFPFIDRSFQNTNHNFIENTHFSQILDVYIFDRQLRLLVMEAIERIEVALRTMWANELSIKTNDAHAYMQSNNFKYPRKHQYNIEKVRTDISKSTETFITHYLAKYNNPALPPIWAMAETLSFGALSHWYADTKDNQLKQHIARSVGLPTVNVMEGVLHALTLVRNICAHHSRLWNRQLTKSLPNIRQLSDVLQLEYSQPHHGQNQLSKKLYNYLVVIDHMMRCLQPKTQWRTRLKLHLQTLPFHHHHAMGFPENWQEHLFWGAEQ